MQFFRVCSIGASLKCAPHSKRTITFSRHHRQKKLNNRQIFCAGLAAALALAAAPAIAQVYSWRDPVTNQSKFSNLPPPWYNRGETVRGPRVVATVGDRVIDDTSLPYAQRLLLSGRSKPAADNSGLQAPQPPTGQQQARR